MNAFLFSGQGAQKPGMGKSVYDAFPSVRALFDEISEVTGKDIPALCFESEAGELNKTQNAQLALYATDLAMFQALKDSGVTPDMCAGFSLGEYPALTASGVLSVSDGAKLVERRSAFMSMEDGGAMAAVLGMEENDLQKACEEVSGYVTPVNFNCPGQIVVAGEADAVKELRALLKGRKIRALPLKVSGAFHSKCMADAADKLRPYLEKAKWNAPVLPLYLNLTGQMAGEHTDFIDTEFHQCQRPVYWEKEIRGMIEKGADTFIECGPGGTLTGFMGRIDGEKKAYCVDSKQSLDALLAEIK